MNRMPMGKPGPELFGRSARHLRSQADLDSRAMVSDWSPNMAGPLSDRLQAAVMELVGALRDEIAAEARPSEREPDRLLSIDQAAHAMGIGRTALYSEIAARRIRSVKVGRRRLIPSSAIGEVGSRRE
jgi:excisionase family DNA binding protein